MQRLLIQTRGYRAARTVERRISAMRASPHFHCKCNLAIRQFTAVYTAIRPVPFKRTWHSRLQTRYLESRVIETRRSAVYIILGFEGIGWPRDRELQEEANRTAAVALTHIFAHSSSTHKNLAVRLLGIFDRLLSENPHIVSLQIAATQPIPPNKEPTLQNLFDKAGTHIPKS